MIGTGNLVKNTSYKVVVPFYAYAAFSFLVAAVLLVLSSKVFGSHYFQPPVLAVTHTMALGWGTMMIMGAGHQLFPVMIEGKLFSNLLAHLSFALTGCGIPLLVYAFYTFNMNLPAQCGALLINGGILCFLINIATSLFACKKKNIHALFVFTATLWLFTTTIIGLLLVFNFTHPIFGKDSLHYLSLHAHLGIGGWFLLLVIGVGTRLIPMFLISKYTHAPLLWTIFALINAALVGFILIFLYTKGGYLFAIPLTAIFTAVSLFVFYCYQSYKKRIRKQTDNQIRISLLSAFMMGIPLVLLAVVSILLAISKVDPKLITAYGFSIFFGWITAIIFGMTFKTLPFIIWNKVYHHRAGLGKTPNPKDLFDAKIFNAMGIAYLSGFILFIGGVLFANNLLLKVSAAALLLAAILYNWNVYRVILHTPAK
ncbi:cytochrome C oxidase subunit I [Mucilaginibacter sp.]|jgi:hypothetical protein|uniref:cytochrome C oxidase subunit I n=1 Tax=Mucilaginibacter sp. TaxID=1882438 RepID=UPI002C94E75C|nr:cytochrome C oxidase subunit I [Mucilaginibacter sp.]HTI59005.1 hypothetical protein [Mucilaginibacter sp.]